MKQLKNSLLSNATLKIFSLIFGSSMWMILNNHHARTIELQVPVCLFDQKANQEIIAPSDIVIALNGKRKDLQTLDMQSLAVHINAQKFMQGTHSLIVDSSTLFLPNSVKLVHYTPSNSVIKVVDHTIIKNECVQEEKIVQNKSENTSLVTLIDKEIAHNQNVLMHPA